MRAISRAIKGNMNASMSSGFNVQVRLFHHHCRQAAGLPVLIVYVEKTDYTEAFYHSNEVLTLMLVLRVKVVFHSLTNATTLVHSLLL